MSINWPNFELIRDHPFLTIIPVNPMILEFANIPAHDQMAMLVQKCRYQLIELVGFGVSPQSGLRGLCPCGLHGLELVVPSSCWDLPA